MAARMYEIARREIAYRTPWFDLVAKTVRTIVEANASEEVYYAIASGDYVTVLPITSTGEVVLVRQFRPALETFTLELPSGHIDRGEGAEQAARRELREETGYDAVDLELVGKLFVDSGRRENMLWCYLARDVKSSSAETELDVVHVDVGNLRAELAAGTMRHALDLAVLACAIAKHGPALLSRPPSRVEPRRDGNG